MVTVFEGNVCAWAAVVASRMPRESALHDIVVCRIGFLFCRRVHGAPLVTPSAYHRAFFGGYGPFAAALLSAALALSA